MILTKHGGSEPRRGRESRAAVDRGRRGRVRDGRYSHSDYRTGDLRCGGWTLRRGSLTARHRRLKGMEQRLANSWRSMVNEKKIIESALLLELGKKIIESALLLELGVSQIEHQDSEQSLSKIGCGAYYKKETKKHSLWFLTLFMLFGIRENCGAFQSK